MSADEKCNCHQSLEAEDKLFKTRAHVVFAVSHLITSGQITAEGARIMVEAVGGRDTKVLGLYAAPMKASESIQELSVRSFR